MTKTIIICCTLTMITILGILILRYKNESEFYKDKFEQLQAEKKSLLIQIDSSKNKMKEEKDRHLAIQNSLKDNLFEISEIKNSTNAKLLSDTTGIWGKFSVLPIKP